ncbi:endonuclease/exonuclease/phosphatase family protein [Frigoriglobus tundricola]|uniref:endonuclease/exonuclease/phosphatase family protein n=1 Tax=Frigoriglobus tundricola TaxID=2774151 RepID=UPI001D099CBF|nr:endonuclease/exonuclease/phosphatase family protein [Frigoriglobus tundricola]
MNRSPLDERVGRVVASERVDIVMLAEPDAPAADLAVRLGQLTGDPFVVVDGSADRFTICSRLPRRSLRLQFSADRWLIYRLVLDPIPELLVALAHLPSKLHAAGETQTLAVAELVADIARAERRRKHQSTVVVGDMNMNPFEAGVAGAGGLHGVMSAAVAARASREIQGREYQLFYNPMWSVMGDRSLGPPGTFYRSAAEAVNYYWNTYDQVLLRPELADRLKRLDVLSSDGVESLMTRTGLPDVANGSDHLPLLFCLEW